MIQKFSGQRRKTGPQGSPEVLFSTTIEDFPTINANRPAGLANFRGNFWKPKTAGLANFRKNFRKLLSSPI